MNECCDWHAICLNSDEEVVLKNTVEKIFVSYCPECNSVFECIDNKVSHIEGEKRNYYIKKYNDKIVFANSKNS